MKVLNILWAIIEEFIAIIIGLALIIGTDTSIAAHLIGILIIIFTTVKYLGTLSMRANAFYTLGLFEEIIKLKSLVKKSIAAHHETATHLASSEEENDEEALNEMGRKIIESKAPFTIHMIGNVVLYLIGILGLFK